ncbi:MAG TPA: glucose-6-phosphate isomerase [Aquabacterium sp.]|nr:glucose-6-phosphate isomerase [Aquabacterium sp.]HQC98601.1 glucose-6-phosphate isomerase [Aquabacterium sp.]
MDHPRCDATVAWAALQGHFEAHGRELDLREAFSRDAGRFATFSLEAAGLFADLSKNLWDLKTRKLLIELAREVGLEGRREAMLAGAAINTTEGRAVLHTALRAPRGQGPHSADVHGVLDRLLDFAEQVRDTAASGIRHVVNIGIGGSDLGPQMVVPALDAFAHPGITLHFVSNVDGHDITPVLRKLKPAETLFIVASKTFTTQETMANAAVARQWFLENGGTDIAKHFVGATTNLEAAAAFGIHTTFGFWDWVGGRYSLWSAIGLPIAIAVGSEHFRALLAGAHAMDRHFATAPLEANLPALLGLLDVWYRNFHKFTSRSVAPYHQGLKRLPAYLQQLEMESNGKCVDLDGAPLPFGTSPVVWGEPGTNGQHAYFQMLHQGTDVIPVEFIAVKHPTHGHADLHAKALANCLAQSQALMQGKATDAALAESAPTASASLDKLTVARHRTFPGNRPSTTLLIDTLTPHALGALIALYEHRVFTSGAVWGINPFDQWGVELGKALANQLLPRITAAGPGDGSGLDASTAGLLARLKS